MSNQRILSVKPFATTGQRLAWISVLVAALPACSVLQEDKVDYKSASAAPTLEVPPDLSKLATETRYTVPGTSVTASSMARTAQAAPASSVALATVGDVRIEKLGNQRWLVVKRTPEQLWSPVRDFWQENGFLLTVDQPAVGIMETDWAENRAKIPQDIIRQTIGKVFDSLYSTGERDKFRIRLERNPSGGTDIFVTHRGMEEVYSSARKDSTIWQPRARDPELEAEFLRRLMVRLGVSQEQSKAALAAAASAPATAPQARVVAAANGAPQVQLTEDFDRAWRRVGLALDRTGFTVEDRDRSKGIYFVRYVDPSVEKQEPGFFGKLFGRGSAPLPTQQFQVVVRTEGQSSQVSVLDRAGAAAPAADAQRIVKVLADELK